MNPHRIFAVLAACIVVGAAQLEAKAGKLFNVVPVAGTLDEAQYTRGPVNLALSAQPGGTDKTYYEANFAYRGAPYFMEARIGLDPSNVLGSIVNDVWVAYAGETGTFLPLNLIPYMGLGSGLYGYSPSGSVTSFDLFLPVFAPIGLQYNLPLGPLVLGADATYFWEITELSGQRSRFDATRMRFELSARLDWLSASVYTESGQFLNGTGARVGMNF